MTLLEAAKMLNRIRGRLSQDWEYEETAWDLLYDASQAFAEDHPELSDVVWGDDGENYN